jgi:hypothetical protein
MAKLGKIPIRDEIFEEGTYGEEFWEFWKVVNFKSAFFQIFRTNFESLNKWSKLSDFQKIENEKYAHVIR